MTIKQILKRDNVTQRELQRLLKSKGVSISRPKLQKFCEQDIKNPKVDLLAYTGFKIYVESILKIKL